MTNNEQSMVQFTNESAVIVSNLKKVLTAEAPLRVMGGFNMETVATLLVNGVKLAVWGPACTWHDDPCYGHEVEMLDYTGNGAVVTVGRFNCDRSNLNEWLGLEEGGEVVRPAVGSPHTVIVDRSTFAKACAKVGVSYRWVEET